MKIGSRVRGSVLFRSLVLFAAPVLHAQSYKLSHTVPPGPGGGDVRARSISPDGTRVVYHADQETYGIVELFSAPVDGSGPPLKLNAESDDSLLDGTCIAQDGTRVAYLVGYQAYRSSLYGVPIDGSAPAVLLSGIDYVARAEFSLDSGRVVYVGEEVWHTRELFSAPADGSAARVQLNGSLPPNSQVSDFEIGAGQRVAYTAGSPRQLYSVPVDGSAAPLQLTSVPTSSSVAAFELTPDRTRAVFIQHQSSPTADDRLLLVPLDGSSAPLALTPLPLGGIQGFRVDPSGTRVVYRAWATTSGVYELFSVPLDGSAAPVRLNPAFPADRAVLYQMFAITTDGARVLYVADQSADELHELWSAPLDGSAAAVRLSATLVPGGDVACVAGVERVSAGARVVYVADQDTDGVNELYSVPADGSGAVLKLNGPLASASVRPYSEAVAAAPFGADATRAVFALDVVIGSDVHTELYSVPVDASAAPVALNGALVPGGSVATGQGWSFAPGRVLFVADQDSDEVGELYGVPLDGSAGQVKLSGAMAPTPPAASIGEFTLTAGTGRAVYMVEHYTRDVSSVLVDGSQPAVALAQSLSPISAFDVTPDGSRVALGEWILGGGPELRSIPADGSTTPTQLLSGLSEMSYSLAPDSAHAVVVTPDRRLLSVTLDGSAAPTYLTGAPPSGSQAQLVLAFSPLGDRVVFRHDRDLPNAFELYSVPLLGGAGPVRLNPPLPSGRHVSDFALTSDGTRVVYLADPTVAWNHALYVVPITGGSALRLSPPFTSGGDVMSFAISPDGARVVYAADANGDFRHELYSVPITGGSPVMLNPPLVPGGGVEWGGSFPFVIAPDSARVVYHADQDVDDRLELYSVPIAGGTAVKLNGPLGPDGRAQDPRVSSDGRFVVFRAGARTDLRFDLFVRRIDGSGSARRLNAPLPPGGSVELADISPDGHWVVYVADQEVASRRELFYVPIGSGVPRKLNGPLVAHGDVARAAISSDSRTVVYTADQDTNEVYELFASRIESRARRTR